MKLSVTLLATIQYNTKRINNAPISPSKKPESEAQRNNLCKSEEARPRFENVRGTEPADPLLLLVPTPMCHRVELFLGTGIELQ